MFWLSLPLFLLGVIFTGVQLTNQIHALNQIYQVRSEYTFKNIQEILSPVFANPETFENLPEFKNLLQKTSRHYQVTDMDVFSVIDNQPLFTDMASPWNKFDYGAIEDNLSKNKKNSRNAFSVYVNKVTRQLTAYIPFHGRTENEIYMLRVTYPLSDIWRALAASRWALGIMLFMIFLTGFAISQGLARSIVRPIIILNEATREIMRGDLGRHVHIQTGDEIQALAETFNQMSDALKEMQKKAVDANPLTGLPGNRGILDQLQKRIFERQKFVMFHADLDRFKVFNDHFGLAAGDKAIKKTADLLRKVSKEKGAADDFVGHIGGDDFVLLTRPQKAKELAETICAAFKQEVVLHLYPKEDYARGSTMQLDRRRQTETGETVIVPFPLLAISLAGISNVKTDFADYSDCMARVAPIKKEVKKVIESSYIIKE